MEEEMATVEISQDILERFRKVSTATVYSGVRRNGSPNCFMEEVHAMTPGQRMAGRAQTIRCLPPRPDLNREVQLGEDSPDYEAMALCGPDDVLVVDAMRKPYATILGDVKLLQLQMQKADGFVTDGAIRDLGVVNGYGFPIFAQRRTPTATDYAIGYEGNVAIQCAGVLVRPGDVIVGDDDGVVVVPAYMADEVIAWVEEHEEAEEYVKSKILAEGVRPGRYYPPTEETIEEMRRARPR
jgi:regulator of RNase E activity RraA